MWYDPYNLSLMGVTSDIPPANFKTNTQPNKKTTKERRSRKSSAFLSADAGAILVNKLKSPYEEDKFLFFVANNLVLIQTYIFS